MRRTRIRMERRSPWGLGVLAVLLVLAIAPPVSAEKPIVVSAADPDMGEQGTLGLEVTVSGDNFPSDAWADFFVTGTTDPGGITVKNVKRQGPKSLKVTIDIDEAAQTELKFDIQVRSRGNGRSGKGTELFGVVQKSNNQDTTPPAPPINLHVVDQTFNTATVEWTMPADDGESSGGPVSTCWCSTDGQNYDIGSCGIIPGNPYPGWGDPEDYEPWPEPGEQQTATLLMLDQETSYHFWVLCRDDALNWSEPSDVEVTTSPFVPDPTWAIEEVTIGGAAVQFDAFAGHGYVAPDEVLIAGTVVLWNQNEGSKKWPVFPRLTRFVSGTWDDATGWSWRYGDYEDIPGFAGLLHIDPFGNPVLEGTLLRDARTQTYDLVYAYHDGSGWRTEIIATESGPSRYRPGFRWERGFAFDSAGNPAIAWCADDGDAGPRFAQRVGPDQWSVETISQEVCEFGRAGLAFDGSGNPAVSYVLERPWPEAYEAKVSIRWPQGWVEEEICRDFTFPYPSSCIFTPWLAFDPARGDLTAVALSADTTPSLVQCDRNGPDDWDCTKQAMGTLPEQGTVGFQWNRFLEVDAFSEMFVAHVVAFGPGFALSRQPAMQSAWIEEYVDHPSTKGLPNDAIGGPFLALDPSTQLPTLAWQWNVGEAPASEHHLYFAWKTAP